MISLENKNQAQSWQTPEEGRKAQRPKRCDNRNKDGDNITIVSNVNDYKLRGKKIRHYLDKFLSPLYIFFEKKK